MIEEAIFSILSENTDVAALVASKIYPVVLPQSEALPALTYSRVSTIERGLSHSGPNRITKAVYQISCWHSSALGAKTLARAIYGALHGFSGAVGNEHVFYCQCVNEVDAFDDDTGIFQVPVDVLLMYREP